MFPLKVPSPKDLKMIKEPSLQLLDVAKIETELEKTDRLIDSMYENQPKRMRSDSFTLDDVFKSSDEDKMNEEILDMKLMKSNAYLTP